MVKPSKQAVEAEEADVNEFAKIAKNSLETEAENNRLQQQRRDQSLPEYTTGSLLSLSKNTKFRWLANVNGITARIGRTRVMRTLEGETMEVMDKNESALLNCTEYNKLIQSQVEINRLYKETQEAELQRQKQYQQLVEPEETTSPKKFKQTQWQSIVKNKKP